MKVIPLFDQVLIDPEPIPHTTESGLVFSVRDMDDKPIAGRVLAVGPGRLLDSGHLLPPAVSPGDRVLMPQYGGNEININGKKLVLFAEPRLLAVTEEKLHL